MSDHHHHHHEVSGRSLFITIVLNVIITIAQVVGGVISGSLALLSDAVHNLSDVLSLLLAYGANRLAKRPTSETKTFGYKRAEIIATFFNAATLIGIAIFLIVEAVERLITPQSIDSLWVVYLGILGIVVNGFSVLLVKDDAHENMNMKAAYLHLLADVMTSVAVVVGGVLIYFYDIVWVDAVITLFIALFLIRASWGLVKASLSVLMQFVPSFIDLDEVTKRVLEHEEIATIHHVHVWQLDEHHIHLEAHLDFVQNLRLQESEKIIDELEKMLHDDFDISHVTFQCEYNRCDDKEVLA